MTDFGFLNLAVEYWPIARLNACADNARTHSRAQIAQIASSIQEFGFNNPILVDPEGGIIAGHGRLAAARKLGCDKAPVIVLAHLNEVQKNAFRLADNQLPLNAGWDEDKLREQLQALATQDFDLQLLGFDERSVEKLLKKAKGGSLGADEAPAAAREAVSRLGICGCWAITGYYAETPRGKKISTACLRASIAA